MAETSHSDSPILAPFNFRYWEKQTFRSIYLDKPRFSPRWLIPLSGESPALPNINHLDANILTVLKLPLVNRVLRGAEKMRLLFSILTLFAPLAGLNAQSDIVAQVNHAETMDEIGRATDASHKLIKIAVLVYDDIVLQDFAGPMEVFSKARNLTHGKYEVFTVGLFEGPVETENGLLEVIPDFTISNMPHADFLIVPGASMPVIEEMLQKETLHDFLVDWSSRDDTTTVSICTASYLLADTGLLNGARATTHYFVADDFSSRFPEIKVIRDIRFVDAGRFLTSSGVTSGIDAALHIVGENSGVRFRDMISRALQYEYHVEDAWPVAPNGMRYERP